ncbi:MAG TPA: hypothetical protein VEK15_07985 [Vicinamibacteria bacterium]|nr:hypothetical protein [Vicinamibacteria bacterium]
MVALEADEIFACLDRHKVSYVLIGGLAAVLHGSPLPTVDVDICPSKGGSNLGRLAAALEELDARIRTPDVVGGVKFPHDAAFLANVALLNLVTRYGDLDLSFEPAGTEGFTDLARGAVDVRIRGIVVKVAALQDVIRSKEAANRPKDQRTLPVLRLLLDEIEKRRKSETRE